MRLLYLSSLLIFHFNLVAQVSYFQDHIQKAMVLNNASETNSYLDSLVSAPNQLLKKDTLALINHKIGIKFYQEQNFQKAIDATLRATRLRESLLNEDSNIIFDLAQSYSNLGGYYRELSEETQNLIYTDSVLYYFKKVGEIGTNPKNFNYAYAQRELGTEYRSRGDYAKSLDAFNIGIRHLQKQDSLDNYGISDLATLYSEREDLFDEYKTEISDSTRLENMLWAIKKLEQQEIYPELALAHGKLALIYENSNQFDSTIVSFENAIYWHEELLRYEHDNQPEKWAYRLGTVWNNFGYFYLRQKQYDKAEECFKTSLKIKTPRLGTGNHPDKATYYVNLGEVYQARNNPGDAVQLFHRAIGNLLLDFKSQNLSAQPNRTQLKKCSNKVNLLYALGKKAEALIEIDSMNGNNDKAFVALRTLKTADKLVDIMRADHSETPSKLFWREKTRSIYEQALSVAYRTNNEKDAFFFFEKSKSILLLDAMKAADARQLIPADLAAEEMRLLGVTETVREASTKDKAKHIDYLTMSDSLTAFRAKLAVDYPRYYQARYVIDVGQLTEEGAVYSYHDKTEYVHFFYGDDHIYMLHFGAGQSNLSRTTRTIETDVLIEKFLFQFSSPNIIVNNPKEYNNLAYQIYELLLDGLFPNKEFPDELVLLPDAHLNLIPFDALKVQRNSTSSSDYLIQKANIRYAYSINVLKKQQAPDNKEITTLGLAPFAEIGDSLILQNSETEMKAVQQFSAGLFSKNHEATQNFFLKNASGYPFLHLSTHASEQGRDGNPEILFADEPMNLKQLYAQEFNNNLIILSACETGLGEVKKGEGVLSLNRGFTYAGAKSIISSLWLVNDRSTSEIIGKFYKNLSENISKSNSLHLAKKDFLQETDALFQSPYYWAALTYSGSDNKVYLRRDFRWTYLLLSGIGLFLVAIFFFRREKS